MIKRTLSLFLIFYYLVAVSQEKWENLPEFPGQGRYAATGFSMNGKGYVLTGYVSSDARLLNDCWRYDPLTGLWTQVAPFPGYARWYASSFVIGGKAYVCMGDAGTDVWEYDGQGNTWTRKNDFPGPARSEAVAFSVGGKSYLGLGADIGTSNFMKDLWQYEPLSDTWTRLPDFPGGQRGFAVSFVIGPKAYVCAGEFNIFASTFLSDLWEFNSATESWSPKQSMLIGRSGAVAFSLGSFGYVGMGKAINGQFYYPQDNWRYDPGSDQWTPVPPMPKSKWSLPVTFTIGDTAYVATGWPGETECMKFYIKDQNPLSVSGEVPENAIKVFPNPGKGSFKIACREPGDLARLSVTNVYGASILSRISPDPGEKDLFVIDLTGHPPGIYLAQISDGKKKRVVKLVLE